MAGGISGLVIFFIIVAGGFAGVLVFGAWLHLWVYIFGGRRGIWQTIKAVVLPNSISGILTGVILQVSRAAGETAPIMFTGVVFFKAVHKGDLFPYGLHEQCMSLLMHLYTLSTQVPYVKESIPFATAVVLLGSVLLVNAAAISLRAFLRARKKW